MLPRRLAFQPAARPETAQDADDTIVVSVRTIPASLMYQSIPDCTLPGAPWITTRCPLSGFTSSHTLKKLHG